MAIITDMQRNAICCREEPCPRCLKGIGQLDSTAFVLDTNGDTLSIHAGCLEDTDEVLEWFSYGEKAQKLQADWCFDGESWAA